MSLNAIQGATLLAIHDFVTKLSITVGYRAYTWLETDEVRKAKVTDSPYTERACKAQLNVAEWSGVLMMPLLLFHVLGIKAEKAAALAVVGQIGYFWSRVAAGYPNVPTATFGALRYLSLGLTCTQMYKLAFGSKSFKI